MRRICVLQVPGTCGTQFSRFSRAEFVRTAGAWHLQYADPVIRAGAISAIRIRDVEPLLAGLAMLAILAGGTWFQYRLSKGHMWDPLWMAFSTTFAALLFLTAGSVGFHLDRKIPFSSPNRWSDGVIWWQMGLGAVFAAAAFMFWRSAIRRTDEIIRAERRQSR